MSAMMQKKTMTVLVDASTSEAFAVGDFQRGSFAASVAFTGDVNFEVSNDGTNWDTLTNAAGTFNNITSPAAGKARALPSTLFSFCYARFKTSSNQTTAAGVADVYLYAN